MPDTGLQQLGVLVTRPAHQAKGLCGLIEQAGGRAIRLPVIEIVGPGDEVSAKASLADECSVLISENAGQLGSFEGAIARANETYRWNDLWKDRERDADCRTQFVIPFERGKVHEHRSARIRDIRHMSASQVPGKPSIHRSECEVSTLSKPTQFRVAVK